MPDANHALGSLCRRGHDHEGTGQSLRYVKGGSCVKCVRVNASTSKGSARAAEPPKEPRHRRAEGQSSNARALPFVQLERIDHELLALLAEREEVHGGNYEFGDALAWRRLELHGLVTLNSGKFAYLTRAGWQFVRGGGSRMRDRTGKGRAR